MKRVSFILALFFVSLIAFSGCENKLAEINVKAPAAEKSTANQNVHKPNPWD